MGEKSFCRIGVFYDGSYFKFAQLHFYHDRKLGWLEFRPFHRLIEDYIREAEQGYDNYKVVYAAWFQGLFTSTHANEQQLRNDRNLYHDLMHAGIDAKYLPMSQSESGEKGADVALAIDALQVGIEGKIDVAALVSGDGDLVPLVRALMKQGIRVMAVYFEHEHGDYRSFINDRLRMACNYSLKVDQLENERDNAAIFRGLFRRTEPNQEPA